MFPTFVLCAFANARPLFMLPTQTKMKIQELKWYGADRSISKALNLYKDKSKERVFSVCLRFVDAVIISLGLRLAAVKWLRALCLSTSQRNSCLILSLLYLPYKLIFFEQSPIQDLSSCAKTTDNIHWFEVVCQCIYVLTSM